MMTHDFSFLTKSQKKFDDPTMVTETVLAHSINLCFLLFSSTVDLPVFDCADVNQGRDKEICE
jgi:hypothetical protein